ncbi:MAG TPA: hypothetical protein VG711_11180, partial [Phycisphaerales bacterium]|nr:hypothetical protein [Phycisphaerales bacterium]
SSQQSFWVGRLRWGRGKYFMGSRFYYVLAVSIYRMAERPYVLSGIGILWGYIKAVFARHTRFNDPAYLKHFRRYELRSLLLGKRRTMNAYHDAVRKNFPPHPIAETKSNPNSARPKSQSPASVAS